MPDQRIAVGVGFDQGSDEDWEIVKVEEPDNQPADTAYHPTLPFNWRCDFALRSGAGLRGSENYNREMSTPQNNLAVSVHAQDQCGLLNLPIELRLRIYEQVFSIGLPQVQLKWYPANYGKSLQPSVLSILETCRRIHAEAEPIFYSINTFRYPINTSRVATGFLQAISPNRRDAIRSLTISASSGSEALSAIRQLTLLSKLQKLRIERRHGIRYIEIRTWVVLAKQLKTELEKLSELRELEIFTPQTNGPTPEEEQRMLRLGQIDALLQEVTFKVPQAIS